MNDAQEHKWRETPGHAAKLAAQVAAEYYDRANEWKFEPWNNWTQFVVCSALVTSVVFLIIYWRFVMRCFIGDDTLRIDRFWIGYWTVFKCCGMCDGEWTRLFSRNCCCCLPRFEGRNLKRVLGEFVGILPVPLRVQNIVVGGLPRDRESWFPSKPDIYVQVFPDELQPTLSTEIISEAEPDCVQFSSSLTLLIKDNVAEKPVRFVVKRMYLAGSKELADCYIAPAQLLAWAKKGDGRSIRISMGGAARKEDPLAVPWILMHLSVPMEDQYLLRESGVTAPVIASSRMNPVSTDGVMYTPVDQGEPEDQGEWEPYESCAFPCAKRPGGLNKGQDWPASYVNQTTFRRMDEGYLKHEFPLFNSKGYVAQEGPNRSGKYSFHMKQRISKCAHFLVLIVAMFAIFRFMTKTCVEEYRQLEIGLNWANETKKAVLTDADWGEVEKECDLWHHDVLKFTHSLGINGKITHVKDTVEEHLSKMSSKKLKKETELGDVCEPDVTLLDKERCAHLQNEVMWATQGDKLGGDLVVASSWTPKVFQTVDCWPSSCWWERILKGKWDEIIIWVIVGTGVLLVVMKVMILVKIRYALEEEPGQKEEYTDDEDEFFDNTSDVLLPGKGVPSYVPIEPTAGKALLWGSRWVPPQFHPEFQAGL